MQVRSEICADHEEITVAERLDKCLVAPAIVGREHAVLETQRKVETLRRDPARWWQAAILNTARVGWFSSDRSIREYARMLWGLPAWSQP